MKLSLRPKRRTLRRLRHLDYDIVRKVSVESLTFFGTLAFFVGVAFNIGLFARFGFIYISLIALEDMITTALALIIFLAAFYLAALGVVSQAYLAYELWLVVRRRGLARFGRAFAFASLSALAIVAAIVALIVVFGTYRGAQVRPGAYLLLAIGLVGMIATTTFATFSRRRLVVLVAGLHFAFVLFTGVVFGLVVAHQRERRTMQIVFANDTVVEARVLLLSRSGIFYRTQGASGSFQSHFVATTAVKRVSDLP